MTSSAIFEKRGFLWEKEHIQIGKGGEQISATQTCYRRGLGAEPPSAEAMGIWGRSTQPLAIFLNFLEKNG